MQVNEYRQNPLNPSKCKKSSKKLREEAILIDLKKAFRAGELNLNDYMYAIAANIEFTEYLQIRHLMAKFKLRIFSMNQANFDL